MPRYAPDERRHPARAVPREILAREPRRPRDRVRRRAGVEERRSLGGDRRRASPPAPGAGSARRTPVAARTPPARAGSCATRGRSWIPQERRRGRGRSPARGIDRARPGRSARTARPSRRPRPGHPRTSGRAPRAARGGADRGAGPAASMPSSPPEGSRTIANRSPPMPVACGSVTHRTAAAQIAASTALPPSRRTSRPASVASGWLEATIASAATDAARVGDSEKLTGSRSGRSARSGSGPAACPSADEPAGRRLDEAGRAAHVDQRGSSARSPGDLLEQRLVDPAAVAGASPRATRGSARSGPRPGPARAVAEQLLAVDHLAERARRVQQPHRDVARRPAAQWRSIERSGTTPEPPRDQHQRPAERLLPDEVAADRAAQLELVARPAARRPGRARPRRPRGARRSATRCSSSGAEAIE